MSPLCKDRMDVLMQLEDAHIKYAVPMLLERVTKIIVTINGHVETKAKNARSCRNKETLFAESCY